MDVVRLGKVSCVHIWVGVLLHKQVKSTSGRGTLYLPRRSYPLLRIERYLHDLCMSKVCVSLFYHLDRHHIGPKVTPPSLEDFAVDFLLPSIFYGLDAKWIFRWFWTCIQTENILLLIREYMQ